MAFGKVPSTNRPQEEGAPEEHDAQDRLRLSSGEKAYLALKPATILVYAHVRTFPKAKPAFGRETTNGGPRETHPTETHRSRPALDAITLRRRGKRSAMATLHSAPVVGATRRRPGRHLPQMVDDPPEHTDQLLADPQAPRRRDPAARLEARRPRGEKEGGDGSSGPEPTEECAAESSASGCSRSSASW